MANKKLKISAIDDGTVIDHIPSEAVFQVAEILKLDTQQNVVSIATNLPSEEMGTKGIVKIAGKKLSKKEFNKIAIVAPKATVNIIKNYKVTEKLAVSIPAVIKDIIKCSNPNCITNVEKVNTVFSVQGAEPIKVTCHYCERSMGKEDIQIL